MLSDLGYSVNLTHELVYPWVSNSADFTSTVVVNNLSTSLASFSFTARRADGSSATSQTYSLNGGGFLQEEAENIFPDFPQGGGFTLTLTSSSPSLAGRWITNDRVAQTPSQGLAVRRSLRPTQRAGTTLNLGYLPGNADFLSGPVLVNMEAAAIDITVYFYDTAGNHINTILVENLVPLTPKVVTVVGATAGDQYAVASAQGLITGAVFVFNTQNQTAIGNATTVSSFTPPN